MLPLCMAKHSTVGIKLALSTMYLCCYLKPLEFFLACLHKGQLLFVSDHWSAVSCMCVPQRQPVCVHCCYRHLEPRLTQLTTTRINFSAGFVPPSGTQQPSGYQIPPQHLYSRGGGHWPSFNPSLLPHQGSTHHGHYSILLSDEASCGLLEYH